MRTISLGEIILTTLRGYHWEINPGVGEDGKRHAIITEVYVVTDEGYSHAPEGQQRKVVSLTAAQQTTLDNLFKAKIKAAAAEQSVEVIPSDGLVSEG